MNPFRVGKKSGKKSNRVDLVDLQGKSGAPVVVILPYGMFANASNNSAVGVLGDQCNEASLYGIPFTVNMDQLETLESGEVAFGIPGKTARVKFLDNDKVALYNNLISLLEIVNGLIDEIKAITTTGSPATHTISGASQAQLELYKTEVEKLLNGGS